ncbi:ferredoxin [Nocardiopsis sp. NPDC058631]|uniref:ferredoxin n=1 Tax=Nocardiopsis sp. NPDC058631 TaxID=3346566 RepID=UPI00364CA278
MRVEVDYDQCESNALCVGAAPEVFEVRDDDLLHLLTEEPPAAAHDRVRRAERLCPKRAITVLG